MKAFKQYIGVGRKDKFGDYRASSYLVDCFGKSHGRYGHGSTPALAVAECERGNRASLLRTFDNDANAFLLEQPVVTKNIAAIRVDHGNY